MLVWDRALHGGSGEPALQSRAQHGGSGEPALQSRAQHGGSGVECKTFEIGL